MIVVIHYDNSIDSNSIVYSINSVVKRNIVYYITMDIIREIDVITVYGKEVKLYVITEKLILVYVIIIREVL